MAHAGLDDARDSKAKGGGGARKGAAGARCERRRGAGASRNNFARRTAGYGRRLARKGERQGRQLLEESIYSADDTLSRLLFLLHVSEGSWAAGRGDQPERIFREAREFLRGQGYRRTLDYLAAMCELVLERTGLLPHANPGVMDGAALDKLKESNASVGLMLENVSVRLMRDGLPHANAPDKVPSLRLRTIEEAGKRSIAFTTGILIGIGETMEERIDSLLAIRKMHEKYGHIQEVIVQNFRAKPQIPMAHHVEPSLEEMLRTLAVARLILGAEMNLQAPPNLSYEAREHFVSARVRQKMNALAAADGFAAQ